MPKLFAGAPKRTNVFRRVYSDFRGVDFSCDPAEVDDTRSPMAVNLIRLQGAPEKRPGWRKVCDVASPVRGIYRYAEQFAVHAGDRLYRWDGEAEPVMLMEGLAGESSCGFYSGDKLYILTGAEYIYLDGESAGYVRDIAYAPITGVNCQLSVQYHDSEFKGESYEDANTVTNMRRNSFEFDPDSTWDEAFAFVDKPVSPDAVLSQLELESEKGNVYENCLFFGVEGGGRYYKNETYAKSVPDALYIDMRKLVSDMYAKGDKSTAVNIKYPAVAEKSCPVDKCRIAEQFSSHIFVSGNPEFPNADWYSELNDPTYFKDISYTQMGSDTSPICAYLRCGDKLAVIKKAGLQDAGVYLRSYAFDDALGTYFPIKQGITGCGAADVNTATATLIDDAMFLSDKGVMAVASEYITGERVLRQRSTRVNNRLLKEDISTACAGVWCGHLVLGFENGHVYLADARRRSYPSNTSGSYEYDWYYWEDMPMSAMCVSGERIYFGDAEGKLCVLGDMPVFSDLPDGSERAIIAQWATKFDSDGDFMVKKNMTRRGCGVFLKGSCAGKVKIAVVTDKEPERVLCSANPRSSAEYESVNAMPGVAVATNRKVKKYTAVQLICRSEEPQSPFGILSLERRYTTGYFNK